MTLFSRSRRTEKRAGGWDSVAEIIAMSRPRTHSGVHVDDEQAMRLGAVWACVDLLSEIVSTLPVDEYLRVPGGPPKPLASTRLLTNPAGDDYGFESWCRQVMTSLLLRGNAFGFINEIGSNMWPAQIEVLNPDRVSVQRDKSFGPVKWRLDGKDIERWPAGPLWHVPAYSAPGTPVGMSPIQKAAETIGLGIATRKFGAQWFGDGAHPTATLESDGPIDEDQAILLKARIMNALHGTREPLVLGGGTKLNPLQVSPDESQFLETSQANVADVARYFRVPPEMIGGKAADNLTYANQEQRNIALLTYTVGPWLVRLERALTRLLPRPRFVKFNADALLRVDLETRYKAHTEGIRSGWLSPAEVREIEDRPTKPELDRYLWPPFSTKAAGAKTKETEGGDDA